MGCAIGNNYYNTLLIMQNYYQMLGIEKAHLQENIPQAFRKRARDIHPDKAKDKNEQ